MITAIKKHAPSVSLERVCKYFGATKSGCYAHLKSEYGVAVKKKQEICEVIKVEFNRAGETYGSPRLTGELVDLGHSVSENTVAKYMKELSLDARLKKRYRVMTTDSSHARPIANRLIKTEIKQTLPTGPGQVLAGDITYLKCGTTFLYLAVVLDLYTREVLGWSMSESMHTDLVLNALESAMMRTGKQAKIIFHSDRGSQYASSAYRRFLEEKNILPSMSRRGNCYDNAYVESFFASLKKERIYRREINSTAQMRKEVFDYIEAWYNRRRRHSSLGQLSPIAYRQRHEAVS